MENIDNALAAIIVPNRQLWEWDRQSLISTPDPQVLQLALAKAVNAIRELQPVLLQLAREAKEANTAG